MFGAPVRLRGAVKPQRAVPSALFTDPKMLMEALTQLSQMYSKLEEGLTRLETIAADWKQVKKGDPGTAGHSPDFEAVLAEVMARMPMFEQLDDERLVRVAQMVRDSMPKPKRGKRGKDAEAQVVPTKEELVAHLKEQLAAGNIKLSTKHIEGFEQTLAPIRNLASGFRGGGDTVVAGTGVVITNTINGNKQISVSGGGVNIETNKVTPLQVASNVELDLSALPHAFTAVLGVWKQGQLLDPTDPTFGWSRTDNIITVLNGFDTDVFLVQTTY